MTSVHFSSTIDIRGINPYVVVGAELAERLSPGWRKALPVLVRVNGRPEKPRQVNLMPVGDGSFYLYLNNEVREASGTKVGDTVELELQFDEEYRAGPAHPMPPWFSEALERNQRAMRAWDALIPSLQKEILRYFSRLKSPEAQARNAQLALHVLSGGKGRFMARSWNQ